MRVHEAGVTFYRQIALLWAIYQLGNLLAELSHLSVPGNVLGMLILFLLLLTGVVQTHLAFFFVPIAVSISEILNGDPTLTSVFVIATGMIGTFLTPLLLNWFKVRNPLVRGLAYGTTAHGQGTASDLAEGTVQGSMSGVAMGSQSSISAIS